MYGQSLPGSTIQSGMQSATTSARASAQGSRRQSFFGSSSHATDHAGGGPGARDVEFDFDIRRGEQDYQPWWTRKLLMQYFHSLAEDSYWNAYICLLALSGIVWVAINLSHTVFKILDLVYNISYAIHVFGLAYNQLTQIEASGITLCKAQGFLIDMFTFSHYVSVLDDFKLVCYYLRLQRPFSYLWALNDKNLKGSVLGTALKYCYVFLVMRVTWALIWLAMDMLEQTYSDPSTSRALKNIYRNHTKSRINADENSAFQFMTAVYLVEKMFVPIGPAVPPANDIERICCLLILLSGCLIITASAVASLSLVIRLYMHPEEAFRTRYRLIIKEMEDSHIPQNHREKVETFYKMYWRKQKAVSATKLLPTFPPTLPATIYADIYFEAILKSRILCDLSSQFLSELAKRMRTVYFIPGDAIIKRHSKKSTFIFITYGDIELVTAEDDSTAILRMTRGTVLTPCGVCAPAGFGRSHLEVRAATFCTAHVLEAPTMWRVVAKHGRTADETDIILRAFNEHLQNVKMHYKNKIAEPVQYKSSIFHFKRCLMALKEAKDAHGNLLLARTDVFLEIAGCYIMRNRADTSLTEESDAICLRPTFPCILQPTSSLQVARQTFVACLILVVCFTHPYYLVYRATVPTEFRYFDYVVTAVFVLDLIINLSTGTNVEEGTPITFIQTSSQQMMSLWFALDVLGTAPIFEFIGEGHYAGFNKILRLPNVFRVLKEVEDACVYRSNVVRFCSYTLLLTMSCYLIATFQQWYMCSLYNHCVVRDLTHSPFWAEEPLNDDTVYRRIAFSLYWAISVMTFTSHKEIWGVEHWINVVYTLALLEVCVVLRIFMEAVYSATILVTTALREDYDATIDIVKNFLIRNQVDPILRQRFIQYLQLTWYTDKAYHLTHKKNIFFDLPRHVYENIVAMQRSKYLLGLPFMKYVNKEDLSFISTRAKLFYVCPNEILINTGDLNTEVYVIKQGICEILSPDTHQTVGLLRIKCHFGVLSCLLRTPAYYTIRAVTHVRVFSISRKYLTAALESPQMKDALEYTKAQLEFQHLMIRRKPFIEYKPPEDIPNLSRFPLPRKHEPDSAFLQPFYRLGFLSILRYIFPRMTIRPDGRYLVRYEWFRTACAFTSAMIYPSFSYLSLQFTWMNQMRTFLDYQAYFDICQRMLIGYYNDVGVLVYHPASTAAHYMRGAFMMDLFGCMPLEGLQADIVDMGEGHMRKSVTIMSQVLMMNRLVQLYRYPGAMKILHNYIERRDIVSILMFFPMFIVLVNVVTSFVVLNSAKISFDLNTGTWIIEPFNDLRGSWLILFRKEFRFNLTESPVNLHLASYFWVMYESTTTGFNKLLPSSYTILYVMFLGMLVCAMLITYFSVSIISIRANVNKALAEFQEHMKDIVRYMKREGLSRAIQKEVMDYYEYQWDKMGGVDYRNVFKLCDQITLRTDAILHIYGPTFARCPIIDQDDMSLLRIVGRAVDSAYLIRGMTVVKANDVISDMYFVDYGGVDAKETVGDLNLTFKLPRGSVFGNLDGHPTVRCPVTFEATSRAHLLKINSATFHQIIKVFPIVTERMNKYRPQHDTLYIMGDVADTYHAARQRSKSGSPVVVTSHRGLIKHLYFKDQYIQFYLIIISLLCIYLDVYNAGFQDNRTLVILILYGLDLGFYMKILLHYALPLVVESANIRRVLLPHRRRYFRGEFRYDLISCIPFELLCFASTESRWLFFSILRLNRMFRIVTVHKGLKRHLKRVTINLTLSTTCSVSIWSTLFVHCSSSLWYFIGYLEDQIKENNSWMYKDDGTSWCDNLYICSTYFVLTTFTHNGVGDIMPRNRSEVIFVCILEILSTMIYMTYVGEFSNIIQFQSFRSFSFYSKYLQLQEFLKNNRVSKNLVSIVDRYALHLWRETRGMQAPHFLLTAPHSMRLGIMSAAYMHHLTRHHIFEVCEPAFLRQLVGCLTLLTYNEDMFVVKSSEITDSMYLIHTGKIEEIAEEAHKLPRIYPAGSYFGVIQGLMHDLPFNHSYRTLIKSQVLTLRLDDWLYLLKHYPLSQEAINKHLGFHERGGSSGASEDSWKPHQPPKPALVTELMDRGSPPTPPRDGEAPKRTKFIAYEGPKYRENNLGAVTLQPGLYPSTRRSSDTTIYEKTEVITQKSSVEVDLARRSTRTQMSVTSLQPREAAVHDLITQKPEIIKKSAIVASKDGITFHSGINLLQRDTSSAIDEDESTTVLSERKHDEFVEKPVLTQILMGRSDIDIEGKKREEKSEEHMVTLDITESKTEIEQTSPASEQTLPASENTSPDLEQTLPDLEKTSPALEQTLPALEKTSPALEQTPPTLEKNFPALEQTLPALEQTYPSSETSVISGVKYKRKSVSAELFKKAQQEFHADFDEPGPSFIMDKAVRDEEASKSEETKLNPRGSTARRYSDTNILPYTTREMFDKQLKRYPKEMHNLKAPQDSKKSASADAFTKINKNNNAPFNDDELSLKNEDNTKDETTSKVKRRLIRVRYDNVNVTDKRESTESVHFPFSALSESSPTLRNMQTMDSDLKAERVQENTELRVVGSNISVESSSDSIRILRRTKNGKKKENSKREKKKE